MIKMDFPFLGDFDGLPRGPLLLAPLLWIPCSRHIWFIQDGLRGPFTASEHFYTLPAEVTLLLQAALLYEAQWQPPYQFFSLWPTCIPRKPSHPYPDKLLGMPQLCHLNSEAAPVSDLSWWPAFPSSSMSQVLAPLVSPSCRGTSHNNLGGPMDVSFNTQVSLD